MAEPDSDKTKHQNENIQQIYKKKFLMDNITTARNILDLDNEANNMKIIDQNFNEIKSTEALIIDKQIMKENLETPPLYKNIPNICFNSFAMDYNDDASEFASTFYVKNSFQTAAATVIEDVHSTVSQLEQINFIRTVLNNIIDNALVKCEQEQKYTNKYGRNFLQVDEPFPLSKWRVRRTSSLKQLNSVDDLNNTTKKIVRFADSLGLDLIDVRTFIDEMPKIPLSAFQDLNTANCSKFLKQTELTWTPSFDQPERLANFRKQLSRNFVCLQSALLENNCLKGNVAVENIDYIKLVQIRFTKNNWSSFCDWNCRFLETSSDGFVDKFEFAIDLGDKTQVNSKVQFAVKFRCKDHEFWDNNFGNNYSFDLLPDVSKTERENVEEVINPCCAEFYYGTDAGDPDDTNLTHTLVQDYMSKLLLQSESSNQQMYQKQIRNSERTLEVFVITGILIMCALFLYIEKVIYFV